MADNWKGEFFKQDGLCIKQCILLCIILIILHVSFQSNFFWGFYLNVEVAFLKQSFILELWLFWF